MTSSHLPLPIIHERIARYCAHRQEVVAAYLFGSAARSQAGPLSDVDVAFLLDAKRPRLPHSLSYQAARLTALIHLLETARVDLVLLPGSSPILQHRILMHRQLLFCRNHRQRLAFEFKALQTYLDLKPLYEAQTRMFLNRVQAGGFGQNPIHG